VVAVGGLDAIASFLAAAQALFLHEPRDAVRPWRRPFLRNAFSTRDSIGSPASDMNLLNFSGQGLVFDGARPGRHAAVAERNSRWGKLPSTGRAKDRVIGFHRIDPFIPLEDGSERMPRVF